MPDLNTECLRLRPFVAEDDAAIFALASDPLVARYVRFEAHRDIAETQAFLSLVQQHYQHGNLFALAIALRPQEQLIGSCGFVSTSPERKSAEIGYWLGRPYWGKGYAVEAARTLIRFGFERMGLEKVTAKCFVANHAGQRVIEKLGMRMEGSDRSELIKGVYPEVRLFALEREEWEQTEQRGVKRDPP